MGDVGVETSQKIRQKLVEKVKEEGVSVPYQITGLLEEIVSDMLGGDNELNLETQPSIILVIGVNGVGKTTTIGKLAKILSNRAKRLYLRQPILSVPPQ